MAESTRHGLAASSHRVPLSARHESRSLQEVGENAMVAVRDASNPGTWSEHYLSLPSEILQRILDLLAPEDVAALMCTCTYLQAASRTAEVWQRHKVVLSNDGQFIPSYAQQVQVTTPALENILGAAAQHQQQYPCVRNLHMLSPGRSSSGDMILMCKHFHDIAVCMPNLREVDISSCCIEPDALMHLRSLPMLQTLNATRLQCPLALTSSSSEPVHDLVTTSEAYAAHIAQLTALTRLDIGNIVIDGVASCFTNKGHQRLATLTNLQVLTLRGSHYLYQTGNALQHLPKYFDLPRLQTLALHLDLDEQTTAQVSRLTNLSSLSIMCNSLTLNFLSTLTGLQCLQLKSAGHNIHDFQALSLLTRLQLLQCHSIKRFNEAMPHLHGLTQLTGLQLSNCSPAATSVAALLPHITHLSRLCIEYMWDAMDTPVLAAVGQLTCLTCLHLCACRLDADAVWAWAQQLQLARQHSSSSSSSSSSFRSSSTTTTTATTTTTTITTTTTTTSAPSILPASLLELKLDSNWHLGLGAMCSLVAPLTRLTQLHIVHCGLAWPVPQQRQPLPRRQQAAGPMLPASLRNLDMHENEHLTSKGVACLVSALSNLTSLNADYCGIGDRPAGAEPSHRAAAAPKRLPRGGGSASQATPAAATAAVVCSSQDNIHATTAATGAAAAPLCLPTSLRHLSISRNRLLGGGALAPLTRLTSLHAKCCFLLPPAVPRLSRLSRLRVLWLDWNWSMCPDAASRQAAQHAFRSGLPKLQDLTMDGTEAPRLEVQLG